MLEILLEFGFASLKFLAGFIDLSLKCLDFGTQGLLKGGSLLIYAPIVGVGLGDFLFGFCEFILELGFTGPEFLTGFTDLSLKCLDFGTQGLLKGGPRFLRILKVRNGFFEISPESGFAGLGVLKAFGGFFLCALQVFGDFG